LLPERRKEQGEDGNNCRGDKISLPSKKKKRKERKEKDEEKMREIPFSKKTRKKATECREMRRR
jgi:hypothetical protein